MKEIVCQILGISQGSYYRWKQERPVINLLEKYFSQEDLEEYLNTGRIEKFERNLEYNDEYDEFFLKNALMKIELYGIRDKIPFFVGMKQALNMEPIKAILPVKTFLSVLTQNNVTDIDSFYLMLDNKKLKYDNWRIIIRDFLRYKLSKKEFNVLIKNKIYVDEYLTSLSHLNHG